MAISYRSLTILINSLTIKVLLQKLGCLKSTKKLCMIEELLLGMRVVIFYWSMMLLKYKTAKTKERKELLKTSRKIYYSVGTQKILLSLLEFLLNMFEVSLY